MFQNLSRNSLLSRGRLLVALLLFGLSAAAQNIIVKGTVTSAADNGSLPGVNIVIKNTLTGTSTDADGKFEINAPSNGTLVFSGIGYVTQEVTVNGRATIDIKLAADTKQLEEVVVVGYGTQKRNSMTNSVSQISGEAITKRPVSNIQQSMQGLMPGVTVLDQGGSPGKSNTNIRVRGITTFNINGSSTSGYDLGKNDALVIVDGIEQRLSDINPDDIESVSVLKDASSTAIYGSRATNGVILVTTKRAKGGKVQVDYNGYYAIQKSNNVPKMMGIEAYMREQVAAYTNAGLAVPARFTEESIQAYVHATDREKYPMPNTWFETMLRSAPQQNHTISVAGGTEVIRTRLSARFQDQQGVIAGYSNKIGEFRLNTDYTVSKRLRVSGDINYRYARALNPTLNNSGPNPPQPLNNFFHGTLWAVPKYPDGTYGLSTQGNNPLMFNEIGGQSRQVTDYLAGYVKAEFDIAEGLTFSTQIAGRGTFTNQKNYTNAYTNTDKNTNITKTVAINSLTEVRNTLREYTINNLLTYEKSFGSHGLKALVGYSQIGNTQTFLSAYRERFYNNDIGSIGQGANDGTKSNSGNDAEYGLRSYFGRVNYDYKEKYLFEANGRYDGSSKFTGPKQYSFFPSFSAGWRISKENFWQGLEKTVNDLKLRGSWGITGNQSVDLYSYYSALTALGYSFGGTPVQGYRPTTLANTNLGWESTTQLDLGIDATFLNKRLTFTADYYRKLTDDILLNLDIPATIGLKAPPQNAGSVENKGWEFSLNYRGAASTSGFRYTLGGNLSINENKVVDLKGTGPYITGSDIDPRYIIAKGLPINTLWGYQTDGLFQTQQEITEYKATYAANTKPGDVKYVDRNGDKKINADDMTAIGNSFPKYTFGLNGDFSYKGFDLSILFQGAAKVDARLAGALAEMGNQEGFTHEIYTNNYWTPENPGARFPRPTKFDLRNVATSDRLVIDGSYLRLKNVQLAYNIPAEIVSKLRVSRIRVYTSATNLLTFSKLNEWNLDPEVPSGRAVYFPQTALYTFGLNLSF
ncbi:TonB-linked SusC/RagA family outer membrane protein [Dyadobacter sp. BE34]|uniref:TonB-linked SusC/RagA family outer membrane protein n=1 Tax=Dyadobacter fermentans TaxID=94254 RepID=A0ABU1QQN3_9BACT|nr:MULTISPECIES: TonB-dependent receptor [Dyadobacter]MDR6803451.1 TonB-linked SusC/RagA family outer membrane protein [Dyadobacter fermentans]MDR7041192.1 TonB-linked SusC/RagA family outer membrane protein [Dyadobacter sp. BE242]MDR7195595.1 TonB-linked SusC/RagA family outer membrane protein [Dyadobacter sp. BE34]MDR7213860.1 TonB-linked SusC/RagA family outer membrane protein [Dyadobacter sp. BE31]MDR7261002.1 TonB-linked SusC/RagA family outer membrane protein [Dyadobacter sp. BE32]